MNLPMIPGQNSKGINGASVVTVPANTGTNTSPAAKRAASSDEIRPPPWEKIRCVFSITTMASSTTIPSPNKSANSAMKFSEMLPPTMNSADGRKMKARNILSGTDNATKKALVTPMKNIKTNTTKIKPMMMEFTSSVNDVLALILRSPDILISRFLGNSFLFRSSTTSRTFAEASMRFSPERLMMLRLTTFFPFIRA